MATKLNKFVGIARKRTADKSGKAIIDLNLQIDGHKVEIQLQPTTPGAYDARMATPDGKMKSIGSAKQVDSRHMGQNEIVMQFRQTGAQLRISPQMQDASSYLVFIMPPATPPTPPTVKAAKASGAPRSIKARVTPVQRLTSALINAAQAVDAVGSTKALEKKARAAKLDDLQAMRRGVEQLLLQVDQKIAAERLHAITGK